MKDYKKKKTTLTVGDTLTGDSKKTMDKCLEKSKKMSGKY
jgi:hypothetical protein